jgi:dihydropyrimidinase
MTPIIKGGTVVTADLSSRLDVRIDEGQIVEIGTGLEGGEMLFLAALETAEIEP